MAIKPGLGRKTSNKNPPILSHEFVIQNHADIISCVAMVFVVGLMNESTAAFASAFISLHHNVSGEDPSREQPYGKAYTYIAGIKDYCAIFFYTLTCIIMHAIIQEFVLDKISKKLHLSKFKLARFNESGQLVAFYLLSFVWGAHVLLKEGYLGQVAQLWEGFPEHPMSFLHKFYFIVQLAYYLHMLPELYFQKIKTKEEQQPKIVHSISGFTLIVLAYTLSFQRLALVLLTLHYFSELLSHVFQLIGVFDREERLAKLRVVNNAVFFLARFATSVIGVLTLYYGIGGLRSLLALGGLIALQGYLVFSFITEQLRAKREAKKEAKREAKLALQTKKPKDKAASKEKVKRKKESDLPEADQTQSSPVKQKLK
ncbi:translocating chain-associated membrane protein 1 [Drosophila takahashii]|uniref:translocating chain-associated membrane protein 1 n=1 Tax=Drosophila takahashii TaxID=29030 RepID=UPI001CF8FE3B|nr:translocating chain-associated membrane protein 1 [Drosophila takahashii]XP_017006624.2 translocating chain-associated membrane protein 1 [Drosophila takahashii]